MKVAGGHAPSSRGRSLAHSHAEDNCFIIYLGQTKNKNVVELNQGGITRFYTIILVLTQDSQVNCLCVVNFDLFPSPLRATPGTSLALRAREWGIVWSGPVPGVVGWDKNIFSLILLSKCHISALENCHFSVAASPQESRPGTSIPAATQANKVCIWRCGFKFQTNVRTMPTRMNFLAKERIERNSSLISLALIIRQLK